MRSGNRSFLLTPPGPGAIAVIRVTGPNALAGAGRTLRLESGGALARVEEGRLRYGHFMHGEELVDDVIVSHTKAGGTTVVDIAAHGGVRVIERILQALDRSGFPLAEPGESPTGIWPTRNLIEREACEAMARAKTKRAVRFLAWQRLHLVPTLEALIAEARTDSDSVVDRLQTMIAGCRPASVLIDGATIALIGPPNSGKSTLFNWLVGRPAAVVSDGPGTTRDWVTQAIEVDGVPLRLVDTAGRRAAADELERAAVDAGCQEAQRADLCLYVFDGSVPSSARDWATWRRFPAASQRVLAVSTKLDRGPARDELPTIMGLAEAKWAMVRVSAATGAGLDQLLQEVFGLLRLSKWVDNTPCLFAERQVRAATLVGEALPNGWEAARSVMAERLICA